MSQAATLRILDASLNRAAEGLRVVEDYARFVLGDGHLSHLTKQLRHDLATVTESIKSTERLSSRDTLCDVGTSISTAGESAREDAADVCAASLKRVQQALRSIEEYGKLLSPELASTAESLRYRVYTLEKAIGSTGACRQLLAKVRLCVLIEGQSDPETLASSARELADAGVGMIQLRDKRLEDRELLARAQALVAAVKSQPTLVIINDRPDIALASGADGVHLGQTDMPVRDARAIVGSRALIGVSTHAMQQARQAVLDGASYLGAGPTYPSGTKAFDEFPGLDYLRELAREISLPAFAIGGIGQENVLAVLDSGVPRVAVSGAIASAIDPEAAARQLVEILETSSLADC